MTTAWWLEKVIIPAGIALATVTGPVVTALVLFARSRQRDRDMQWRTDRRDAYVEFITAARAFLAAAGTWALLWDNIRRQGVTPARSSAPEEPDTGAQLLDRAASARDAADAVCGRMLLMCPPGVVVAAQEFVRVAEAEPTAGTLQRQGELLSAFVVAARRDVGLDWPGSRPPIRLPHRVT